MSLNYSKDLEGGFFISSLFENVKPGPDLSKVMTIKYADKPVAPYIYLNHFSHVINRSQRRQIVVVTWCDDNHPVSAFMLTATL